MSRSYEGKKIKHEKAWYTEITPFGAILFVLSCLCTFATEQFFLRITIYILAIFSLLYLILYTIIFRDRKSNFCLFLITLILTIILFISIFFPIFQSVQPWKEPYSELIKLYVSTRPIPDAQYSSGSIAIVDLNNDDIPELILGGDAYRSPRTIYTYANGKAICLGTEFYQIYRMNGNNFISEIEPYLGGSSLFTGIIQYELIQGKLLVIETLQSYFDPEKDIQTYKVNNNSFEWFEYGYEMHKYDEYIKDSVDSYYVDLKFLDDPDTVNYLKEKIDFDLKK